MSNKPNDQHQERSDELDLDAQTVRDLEPSAEDAAEVKGGASLDCCTLHAVSCILTK
jgi:hypothetical protein